MVLDPVDATSASAIVRMAKAQHVPVISYDRLISGGYLAAYISFDNVRVGALQASSLEKKLTQDGSAKGPIVMINGDPTDNNAHLFKQGASQVFKQDSARRSPSPTTPPATRRQTRRRRCSRRSPRWATMGSPASTTPTTALRPARSRP